MEVFWGLGIHRVRCVNRRYQRSTSRLGSQSLPEVAFPDANLQKSGEDQCPASNDVSIVIPSPKESIPPAILDDFSRVSENGILDVGGDNRHHFS